jgi:hypothetical protein
MTLSGHKQSRNPAVQQSPVVPCVQSFGWGVGSTGVGSASPRFRTIQVYPKDIGRIAGHTRSVNRPRSSRTHYGRRERDHDAPLFAKPRWLAVPGIGFPQNISVGPNVPDPEDFRDWSFTARRKTDGQHDAPAQLIDCIASHSST